MSREIKFRAWDKKEKEMCYAFWLGFKGRPGTEYGKMPPEFLHCNAPAVDEMESVVLMQYAGLKDKNGPEMDWWEDDILEDEDGYRFRIDYLGDVGRYGFLALADLPIENYYFPFYDYQLDELKKIGNIHQSPELVEENPND